jgi:hypothetical protein
MSARNKELRFESVKKMGGVISQGASEEVKAEAVVLTDEEIATLRASWAVIDSNAKAIGIAFFVK